MRWLDRRRWLGRTLGVAAATATTLANTLATTLAAGPARAQAQPQPAGFDPSHAAWTALREEAFVATRLDAQLDEQALRFMSDRTRNRFNAQRGRLELSKIFDWYGEDFRLGHRGITSLPGFAARYAEALADGAAERERIRAGSVDIAFTDYDWALNDAR